MGRPRSTLPDGFPVGLAKKNKKYYFVTKGEKRKWIPLGEDFDAAKREATELKKQEDDGRNLSGARPVTMLGKKRLSAIKRERAEGRQSLLADQTIDGLLTRTRANAARKNIRHSLTSEQIKHLLQRSGGRCEVSGILFEFSYYRSTRNRPWVPTIDRINNQHGYTINNCRVVCNAVNVAINEWGDEVLRKIADSMSKSQECEL